MTLSLFDQFASPYLMGIPLIIVAMLIPWFLSPTYSNKLTTNRPMMLFSQFLKIFTKQVFLPINYSGYKWALMFTSLMTFILGMNLAGLLPYTFTPTTQLSLNLGLAIPLWLATVLIGLRNQFTVSVGHLLPEGTPTPLIPVLIIIETVSLFIRPLALGVRLTANLTAGHLLIHLISMAVISIMPISPTAAILSFIVLFLLLILETAVAMIQAYVFILLLSLYLQENTYDPPSARLSHS
uniref:ATP synthase subunit a n=1 Tax=Leptopelis vermiculatus TaxID=39602 RepID=S4V1Q5_9NEOB|nr:ATP synthase F0 subunit 6 [Leptopelis vermiculatus]